MVRATIDKKILDTLIRAKLATLERCKGAHPLPVRWQAPDASGLNWAIEGWAGDADVARECEELMRPYLDLLRTQFGIPSEAPG